MRLDVIAATLVVTVLAAPASARAQTAPQPVARIQACVGDADAGQVLRSAAKLLEARETFRRCADPACPAAIRTDCRTWVHDIEAALPTLDVRVRDPLGGSVSITLDGRRVERSVLEIDPGPHVARAVASDGRTAEASCVITEHERRTLEIVLPGEGPPPAPDAQSSAWSAPTFVALGVAALAFGGAAFFGVRAQSEYDDLERRCAPGCDHDAVATARTPGVIADVLLVTGIVALAATAILYFTSRGPRATALR